MIFIEINYNDVDNSFIIIDIRDNLSYQRKHIKNAINISFINLIINPKKHLNKTNKYLLVCEYGIKSKKTSEILNKQGYKTYSLINGMKMYNK